MLRTRRATAVAVAPWMATAALMAAAAPPAWADPGWLAQPDLTATGENASLPSVAMNGAGDAIVAWQRSSGTGFVAQASLRLAGTSFSAPIPLSAAGLESLGTPQAAIGGAGDAIVVWQEPDGLSMKTIVQAAIRPAGGSFGAPLPLSATGTVAVHPQVAMNAAGDAIVVWTRTGPSGATVEATVRPAGGSFTAPVDVSAGGPMDPLPHAAIDAAGNATVVWTQTGPSGAIVQAATRPAGGTFSTPPDDLSVIGAASSADVATNGAGQTVTVWEHVDGASNRIVQAATRPAGGAFSPPTDLSMAGRDATDPHVALDAAGNALAVWTRFDGTTRVVQSATRASGGSFAAPVNLSLAGAEAHEARVAVNPAGDAIAAWQRSNGTSTIVQAAVRHAGAGFGATTDLSAMGRNAVGPQVALDTDGDALAAWQRSDGTNTIAQAAGYDGAGPQLRGLSVPATTTAATAAGYSLSPLDVWSAIGSTLWSFGDGAIAVGTSVSHAFETAGDQTATVTVSDALGNVTSATRAVAVLAPPQDGGPVTPPPITRPTPPPSGCTDCGRPIPRLRSTVGYSAHVAKRYTVFTRLVVVPVAGGTTVRLRCRGPGCPFATKRRTVATYVRRVDLTDLVKRAKLRRGAQLEIAVTKASTIGTVATIGVRDRRRPRRILRCLFPDSATPSICPA